jgi:hypothetical protein
MPNSLQAAAVFAVLIVPGLLLVRGYNRTRAHTLPSRDLYALGQAIVVSLAWLPVIWVLGGHSVIGWLTRKEVADHQLALLGIVLGNLAVAQLGGWLGGLLVREIGQHPWSKIAGALDWTGIFDPPTAWDAAWIRASWADWAAVEITLKNGAQYNVIFDNGAVVGLSPAPRQLFFDTEYDWADGERLEVKGHQGIYIDAGDIASVRFEHLQFSTP